jgi:hypothetical protein
MLLDCGHEESDHSSFTSGYGVDKDGKKFCYECCANQDKESMRQYGNIDLYLVINKDQSHNKYSVTNWPGSLRIPVMYYKNGKHNMAGSRIDVWFVFESQTWHGVNYGENSEVCHCKKVKNWS